MTDSDNGAQPSMQEAFLSEVELQALPVRIALVSGAQFRGFVKGYDATTIVVEADRRMHLIYKHAIAALSITVEAEAEVAAEPPPPPPPPPPSVVASSVAGAQAAEAPPYAAPPAPQPEAVVAPSAAGPPSVAASTIAAAAPPIEEPIAEPEPEPEPVAAASAPAASAPKEVPAAPASSGSSRIEVVIPAPQPRSAPAPARPEPEPPAAIPAAEAGSLAGFATFGASSASEQLKSRESLSRNELLAALTPAAPPPASAPAPAPASSVSTSLPPSVTSGPLLPWMSSATGTYWVLDGRREQAPVDHRALLHRLSERHETARDGVVLLASGDSGAVARVRVFNADGSEPELYATGMRYAARYLSEGGAGDRFTVTTSGGAVTCEVLERVDEWEIALDVGLPKLPRGFEEQKLDLDGAPIRYTLVNVAKLHAVIFVDDVDEIDVNNFCAKISNHRDFAEGVSVDLAQVIGGDALRVRHWERGIGETRESGSGAVASVVAAVVRHNLSTTATVEAPIGQLRVIWQPGSAAHIAGPAAPIGKQRIDVAAA